MANEIEVTKLTLKDSQGRVRAVLQTDPQTGAPSLRMFDEGGENLSSIRAYLGADNPSGSTWVCSVSAGHADPDQTMAQLKVTANPPFPPGKWEAIVSLHSGNKDWGEVVAGQ